MKEIYYVVEVMNGVVDSVTLFIHKEKAEEHYLSCIDDQFETAEIPSKEEHEWALNNGCWEEGDGYTVTLGSDTPEDL